MISPQRSCYSPSLKGDVFVWIPKEIDGHVPLMKETFAELRSFLVKNNKVCNKDWKQLGMDDIRILLQTNEIAKWVTGPIVLPPEENHVRVISRPKVAHLWRDGSTDMEKEWQQGYQILILKKVH